MKKILSVLLTIVMLAGCLGAAAESITVGGEEVETGLKFPLEEPVTLTIMVNRDTTDTSDYLNSQPQYRELEALTNIHIEWICVPSSGWNERKNLIFASGDYPDAMIDEGITDLDISSNADVLLRINDYLDYMPNMSKAFETFPELRAITTSPDGNIYSLGQRRPLVDTPQMMCINKTWLDALGLEIPTTLDELYDVLVAFKNGDPNGNGDTTDEIPLTFTVNGTTTGWAPLFGSFGIIDYSSPKTPMSEHVNVENGKVVFVPTDERYIEAIEFFHKLYSEGLIDRDVFTDAQINAKRSNNQIGMQMNWSLEGLSNGNNCEWAIVMPLSNGDTKPIYTKNNAATYRRNMAITFSSCEHPEALMAWLDLFYSEDLGIQSYYGPYGLVLSKNEDGTRTYMDPPADSSLDSLKWKTSLADNTPTAIYPEWHDTVEANPWLVQKQENNAQLKAYQPEEIYPNVIYTDEQLERLDILLTDIDTYVERMQAQWMVDGGIREDWDAYLQQLERMGLPELIQIYQDALDTYNQ